MEILPCSRKIPSSFSLSSLHTRSLFRFTLRSEVRRISSHTASELLGSPKANLKSSEKLRDAACSNHSSNDGVACMQRHDGIGSRKSRGVTYIERNGGVQRENLEQVALAS